MGSRRNGGIGTTGTKWRESARDGVPNLSNPRTPADLARSLGFPAETGSRSFWVGANGLVIGVAFRVSGLFYNFNGYLIWVMEF
jgi:hypothetical protein